MASDLTIQGEVVVDSTRAETAFDRVGNKATQMATEVAGAAGKAGQAVDKIGDGAVESASKFTRGEAIILASVRKSTEAIQLLGKTASEKLEFRIDAKGFDRSKFEPALKALREVEAQAERAQQAATGSLNKMGVSAGQTQAALRQLPAQFTDIVTSLQAGQAPLTVLIQQGGQIKDSFGGAGNALKAMSGYVIGLVNPFTVAAAAVGALGFAMYSINGKESALLALSVQLKGTGRASAAAVGDIKALVNELNLIPGVSKASATAIITEFAKVSGVGGALFKQLGSSVADFAAATGTDLPTAAKKLAEAFADPAKGAKSLEEALGTLTAAQLLTIEKMAEIGNKSGAQVALMEALKQATKGLATEAMTPLGKATDDLSNAWDKMTTSVAKSESFSMANRWLATLITSVADLTVKLSELRAPAWLAYLPGVGPAMATAINGMGVLGAASAGPAPKGSFVSGKVGYPDGGGPGSAPASGISTSDLERQSKAALDATRAYESQASAMSKVRDDATIAKEALKALESQQRGNSVEAIELRDRLVGINEKLAEMAKKGNSAGPGENEVAGIRALIKVREEEIAALRTYGGEAVKMTEGDKLVKKIKEELGTSIKGVARAQKELALAAAETLSVRDREKASEEVRIKGLERSKQAYAGVIDEARKTAQAIGQQADELAVTNSMYGKGRVALEQYRLQLIKNRLAEIEGSSEGSYDPAYVAGVREQAAQQQRKVDQTRIADFKAINEQADELLRSAEALAVVYQDEAALSGTTNLERAKIVALRKVELKYAKELAEVDKSALTDDEKQQARDKLNRAKRIEGEAEVSKAIQDDWTKTTDSINQSLTDALLRGFESGKDFAENFKDTLKNMFSTLVLRPVISAVLSPISGAINGLVSGVTGGAGSAGSGSGLGTLLTIGQQAYNAYNGTGIAGAAVTGVQNLLGIGAGAAQAGNAAVIASSYGGGPAAIAAAQNASIAAGGSATGGAGLGAAGAGGIAAIIMLGVINALGGMRTETMIGSGLAGTLGGSSPLTPWQEWREGGTLFDGPSFATHNPLEELRQRKAELQRLRDSGQGESNYAVGIQAVVTDLEKTTKGLATQTEVFTREIGKGYKAYRTNVVDMADSLGLAGDSVKDFAYTLGAQDLNFQGLNPEQIQAKIAETFGKAGVDMAQQLLGTWKEVTDTVVNTYATEQMTQASDGSFQTDTTVTKRMEYQASVYAKTGETAIQTLTRLSTSFNTLNEAADALGFGIQKGSLALADFSDKFIEAFGGLEKFTASTGAFLQNYYTDTERREYLIRSGVRQAEKLGIQGLTEDKLRNGTREQFRDFVNTAASNPELYADALDLANYLSPIFGAFEEQAPVVQEVANVVDELTQAYQNAVKSLTGDRDSLAVEVLRAQGNEAGAKALERTQYLAQFAGLDAARLKEIETLYDGNVATRAYIQGIKDAAQAQLDAIAKLRADSLALIDGAAGKTDAALAAYERAADKERERLQGNIDSIKAVFQAAEDGAKSFFSEVDAVARFQGVEGRDFITQALASVQAGGALPDGKELSDAIAAVSKDIGATQFATQADADFQRLVVANELKGLKDASGNQLDTAEAQLDALNDQVEFARDQVNLLRGIDSSLKDLPTAIANLIAAYNEESRTRDNVKATALLGSGNATYDIKKGVGTTAGGAYFEQDAIIQAAQDAIAQGATASQIYGAIKDSGFSLAQAEQIFGVAPGSLETIAREMNLPVFHDGTNFVPRTGFALLERGEQVVPAAFNPFNSGAGGSNNAEVVAELRAARGELLEMRKQLDTLNYQAKRSADANNGQPEAPGLVTIV